MSGRALVVILFMAIAGQVSSMIVSEVFVSGVSASEQAYVRSILPIAVGDNFGSADALARKATVAESYLEQDGSFTNVSIEIEVVSDSEATVYALLQTAAIRGLSVFGSSMTLIPHFPLYITGFGFVVGPYAQSLGLDVPFAQRLRLDILSGHSQTAAGLHAVSGKAGFNYRPSPLLSFYVPVEVDAYPVPGGPWPVDIALKAGGKIDLSFLEPAYLFGGSLEASARKGLMDFDYVSAEAAAALSFRPFPFLSLSSAVGVCAVLGNAPPLHTVDETGEKSLRVTPVGVIAGSGIGSVSALGRIIVPFKLNLGIMSLAPSVYGFYEMWRTYDVISELTRGPYSSSAGGGLMLELSPPVSLTLEIGYGYSITEDRPVFLFSVK